MASTVLLTALPLLVLRLSLLRRSARFSSLIAPLASICALALGQPAAARHSFTPLGDLPGGDYESYPTAVSADGSVVAGYRVSNGVIEAFRWTANEGLVGLGDLRGGNGLSRAFGISAVVCGSNLCPAVYIIDSLREQVVTRVVQA